MVLSGSATKADYSRSGYDRGHLAPAGDMVSNSLVMSESFFYSNMSPQKAGFNRGIWKKLEDKVRDWTRKYDTLWIVTGPVLTDGLQTIGVNEVSVPEYYYKVLLTNWNNKLSGIGFIMANKKSKKTIFSYSVSIDEVEKVTGIDFFPSLPDYYEDNVESSFNQEFWK